MGRVTVRHKDRRSELDRRYEATSFGACLIQITDLTPTLRIINTYTNPICNLGQRNEKQVKHDSNPS